MRLWSIAKTYGELLYHNAVFFRVDITYVRTFRSVSNIRIVKTTGCMCKYRTYYDIARNNKWCVFTKICNKGIVPNEYIVNGAIVNKCETRNTARRFIF